MKLSKTHHKTKTHSHNLSAILLLVGAIITSAILLIAVNDTSLKFFSDFFGRASHDSLSGVRNNFTCNKFSFGAGDQLVFALGQPIPVKYTDPAKPASVKIYFTDTFEPIPNFTNPSNLMNWREVAGKYDPATGTFTGMVDNFIPSNRGTSAELLFIANVQQAAGGETCSGNPIFPEASTGVVVGTNPRKSCQGCQAMVIIDGVKKNDQTSSATQTGEDLAEYWNLKPGNYWIYQGKNYSYPDNPQLTTFTTRIDIEQPVSICDHTTHPMRFTKDKVSGYWGPQYSWHEKNNGWNGDYVRRWFPTAFQPDKQWNGASWMGSLGGKSYLLATGDDWQKSIGDFYAHNQVYFSAPQQNFYYPPYLISPKKVETGKNSVLFTFQRHDKIIYPARHGVIKPDASVCNIGENKWVTTQDGLSEKGIERDHGWYLDIQETTVSTPAYKGKALRYRWIEFQYPMGKGFILREDWYFAKGIGLVRADAKDVSHHKSLTWEECQKTPMCLGEAFFNTTSNKPDASMELKSAFKHDRLQAKASTDQNRWAAGVTTKRGSRWFVQLNNNYTGWVDAESYTNNGWQLTEKWDWATNGIISRQVPNNLAAGQYKARFRPHIIKTPHPSVETPQKTSEAGWSNIITNRVQ